MSFVPLDLEKQHYRYTRVRFLEREHGVEYLPFELDQMKEFHNAKRKEGQVEVTGYVSWSRPPYFILLPTKTTPNCYLVCKIENQMTYPSLNQFSIIKGKWIYEIIRDKPQKILLVEDIQESNPEFGKIKPHITYNDFIGTLFEKWRNIGETTQKLLAQKLVSCPTMQHERAGGLTLTLANYSKKRALKTFVNDLDRFIPDELAKQKSLSFTVQELGIQSTLPDIGCSSHTAYLSNIPKSIDTKLDRVPYLNDEYAITLVEETMGPLDFDARGLIKSDYPIAIEQNIEKKSNDYDVSLEIYKYLLTTEMCSPIVSFDTYNNSLEYGRARLLDFIKDNDDFSKLAGNNQFLDLGKKGKPLSIHNLAVSFKRGIVGDSISLEDVKTTSGFYFDNLQYFLDIQEDLGYGKISPKSTMSVSERRAFVYATNHKKVTISDIADGNKLSLKDAEIIINSLLLKHLFYEPEIGYYSAVPINV